MTVRCFTWRGFGVELEVPDAVGRRVGAVARRARNEKADADGHPGADAKRPRRIPRVEPLAEPVVPLARDPQRALDFLRASELAGDGTSPPPALVAFLDGERARKAAATTLAERVAVRSWYHTIELPGGVVTPGAHDHRGLPDQLGLPADLTGQRVLDVATFDGFWAFELERRGATVVAVDLPSVAGMDWPGTARSIVTAEGLDVAFGESFAIAHQALGSSVERVVCSVYDLAPEVLGCFDLVFLGDLLLHLERPLEALRHIRSVTSGRLVIVDRFDAGLSRISRTEGPLLRYGGGWNGLEWWAPSLQALVQFVVDAGFDEVDVRGTFRLPTTFDDGPGSHCAVIHAR